jgi:transcriptional regulator with XRE-family HTH domain
MSILAKNLKTIRKELGCTQSVMSEILKVGFRTFVRYEAGARDAPVSVLVKIARLGNISLEQLLTSEIDKNDIAPLQRVAKSSSSTEVSVVDFKEGLVEFNDPPCQQEIITLDNGERKMLTLFRKMGPHFQKDCLSNLGKIVGAGRNTENFLDKVGNERPGDKKKEESPVEPAKNAISQPKAKRKQGRKKLDKKALQEKIDKLKMLTRSINKTTVR